MVFSTLLKIIYPPPTSILVTALSMVSFVSMTNAGWLEFKGQHMQYSKFTGSNPKSKEKEDKNAKVVPSKIGMVVVYTPAFLAGISSFFLFPVTGGDIRFTLVRSAVTTHFFKRVMEVLFLHKFSGSMEMEAMITISMSYLSTAATMIYNQSLTNPISEPAIDLKYIGTAIFLLGISGNFYHHYLLTKLRSKGDKQYKIPKGGLFSMVICPHYLFEILGFIGMCCISQTLYPICYTVGTTFYLMGRSKSTREWYKSKFEDFPNYVKALIPFIL